jgi:cytochrome c-type biogenesis protein
MTVVFSFGIATIMLPIASGVVFLADIIRASHNLVFVLGGFLMILLGFWTLWGHGMLPQLNFPVNLNRSDSASVYVLGLFSGAATTCCAPVLAGVLVLSALSASLLDGLLIGLTYVAGMVFPLFLVAVLWDRYAMTGGNPLRGRILQFRYLGREFSLHSSKLTAGVTFIATGGVTVVLGVTGTMISTPGSALLGVMQAQLAHLLVGFFSNVGILEAILFSSALTLLGAALFVRSHLKRSRNLVK